MVFFATVVLCEKEKKLDPCVNNNASSRSLSQKKKQNKNKKKCVQ